MRFGLTRWNPTGATRWDPFDEMRQIQNQINDMFKEMSLGDKWSEGGILAPLVDVKDEGDNISVTTDLPGVEKEDVDIDVRDNMLTISAKCGKESEESEEGYTRRERTYSMFSRTLALPESVTSDGAKARLENGVLKVTFPKLKIEEKKKIMIE
ncbi:MAG: Hsp20/alpha crystallin family protein [Methanosarcinaceae archaeon]|nr:Hsp20/alpha crystallin family protein [Methanosarcinaceae archaeon]